MISLHIKIQISEDPGLYDYWQYYLGNLRKRPKVVHILQDIDGYAASDIQNGQTYKYLHEISLLLPKLIFNLHELFDSTHGAS